MDCLKWVIVGWMLLGCVGCGDDGKSGAAADLQIAIACDDDEASLYAVPDALPDEQGTVMRCVDDGVISQSAIQARLDLLKSDGLTYAGRPAQSGTHLYRVLYRTERGNGDPGYAVASVYIPEEPVNATLPLLLVARGSRGQAADCAPSRWTEGPIETADNMDGRHVHNDYESVVWPLASSGFALIATDSAGYAGFGAEGNPPPTYADVEDQGKSLIDSAHALRKLLPEHTSDEVLMVGLSQGGHSVLGSLQVANTYPPPGPIKAAAVYAPLWFAQRAWGVVLSPIAETLGGIRLQGSPSIPVSIWYHYTHAELYDGPGSGVQLFRPEVRDAVQSFVDNVCWSAEYTGLNATGATVARELFSEELVASAGEGALNRSCESAPDQELCEHWLDRYRRDHPDLTGAAGEVPLLVTYGLKDQTIGPPRMRCALDKLERGNNSLELCIDPAAGHGSVVLSQSDYVTAWLKNKAFGTPNDLSCAGEGLEAEMCDPLLPND